MYVFIVNPFAGNGKSNLIFEKLQKTADYEQLNSKYYYSEYEGHAEKIAASLVTEKDIARIIVIGGDGTIHEVMNVLVKRVFPLVSYQEVREMISLVVPESRGIQ